MKTLLHLYRWLFNIPVYGTALDDKLYRRFTRSGLVQVKGDWGWSDIERDFWYTFKPTITPRETIRLPDRSFFGYEQKWRDRLGETEFERVIANERQKALQKRLKGVGK